MVQQNPHIVCQIVTDQILPIGQDVARAHRKQSAIGDNRGREPVRTERRGAGQVGGERPEAQQEPVP